MAAYKFCFQSKGDKSMEANLDKRRGGKTAKKGKGLGHENTNAQLENKKSIVLTYLLNVISRAWIIGEC